MRMLHTGDFAALLHIAMGEEVEQVLVRCLFLETLCLDHPLNAQTQPFTQTRPTLVLYLVDVHRY
jgi:hypothetical protein